VYNSIVKLINQKHNFVIVEHNINIIYGVASVGMIVRKKITG